MPIDQDAEDDTQVSATEANDSVADTDSQADSQDSDTQSQEGASETTAPAKAAQQDAGDGSSTTPDTTLQAADKQPDWAAEKAALEKRINDLRSGHSRMATEVDKYRKSYGDLKPEELDQFRKTRELTQKTALPQWNPQNPKHAQFRETVATWNRYKNAVNAAKTPEAKQALIETMGSTFSQEEADTIRAWELHQQQEVARLASDPMAMAAQMRQEAMTAVREEMRAVEEERKTHAWFENPANAPIVERYRDEMIARLNQGMPWAFVQELIEAKAKADGLQSRVGKAEVTSAEARAKTSALKQSASKTVLPDPATKAIAPTEYWKEAVKYAKKNGWPSDHPRVIKYLEDLVQRSQK